MAEQYPFAFVNATVTAGATAVTILSLLQGEGFNPTGACVGLSVTFDANTYWGSASTVTNTDGALVAANTPVTDAGTGVSGNSIPIANMFVYKQAAGDANCVIYARFIP